MIELLIDRVGNVNVFNVLENDSPTKESHLQSIVDEDLIFEFMKEVDHLTKVSRNLYFDQDGNSQISIDILSDLKKIGEAFFDQFFPTPIADKLRTTSEKYLHFHIAPPLSVIPWSVLHNGNCFLSDKFCIGKTIQGYSHSKLKKSRESLKMLIIADPTEDLDWARLEGEKLYKTLKQKVPSSVLDIEFIGGRQVTKLKLLSLIKGKNIIHYSGHLYFSDDPLENGWLLSNDKVIKAREIKSSGFDTDLVFSNSCQSSENAKKKSNPSILNFFAGSFLMSGIRTFIGTNWEIADNENTLDFTIRFYTSLFNDKTIGESLFLAGEYARRNYNINDLTWANYSLHGDPTFKILEEKAKLKKDIINPSNVYNFYPTPIAKSYMDFMKDVSTSTAIENFDQLKNTFEEFSKVIGCFVFSDHKFHSLGRYIPEHPDDALTLKNWWDLIFQCLSDFKKLRMNPLLDNSVSILYTLKDTIYKMIQWVELYTQEKIDEKLVEIYLISFQYYYENLLLELEEFENLAIVLVHPDSDTKTNYYFRGTKPSSFLAQAPFASEEYVQSIIDEIDGKLLLLNLKNKRSFPLTGVLIDRDSENNTSLSFPGFRKSIFLNQKS
ncbi:MAG: CHAT domain-containing protein [Leptospiraceae bacterium]|nr:CHAT domain-containing protein [Leptospiraceae bacterium]MCK6381548.1 CHAT domain-containing protein [Leptospiraceae bacterium]NUM41372.1 CHAT domain-containing protein [Leptospiraceae bacterium]